MKSKTLAKNFKTKYSGELTYDSFFIGNKILISNDGQYLFCPKFNILSILYVADRKIYKTIGEDEISDEITCFALNSDNSQLTIAYRHGIIKSWNWHIPECLRTWKSNFTTPITTMVFDQISSTLLATGTTVNCQIKLWDLSRNYCTHSFKEIGVGGVILMTFWCDKRTSLINSLIAACDNNSLKVFKLQSSIDLPKDFKSVHTLLGHTANVTGLHILSSDSKLLSCGRDKLIILWDLVNFCSLKLFQAAQGFDGGMTQIPSLEEDGGEQKIMATILTADGDHVLRRWQLRCDSIPGENGTTPTTTYGLKRVGEKAIYDERRPDASGADDRESADREAVNAANQALVPRSLTYDKINDRLFLTNYQNDVIISSGRSLELISLFVGDLEEITDLTFFPQTKKQSYPYLAVADNSPQPKIFSLPSFNTFLLYGHFGNVLTMDTFSTKRNLLLTASKDNTMKLWKIGFKKRKFECLHTFVGHTNSVTAVKCSQTGDSDFLISGSSDLTVKYWELKLIVNDAELEEDSEGENPTMERTPKRLKSGKSKKCRDYRLKSVVVRYTVKAHDKEISCICLSPRNAKFFATGSMDKTVKLWNTADGKLVGTLRGHKRGVWDVKFSPVHQVLATCSGDTTIKLWALADLSCVKTLEGHTSAVLRLQFVTQGTQLITSSSDGIVKLWTIDNESCSTFDAHEGKIWSFSLNEDESIMATGGGSDGKLIIWKDVSQEEKEEEETQKETKMQGQQDIANLLKLRKYDSRIFKLTIAVEDHNSLLVAMTDFMKDPDCKVKLEKAIKSLELGEIDSLLRYVSKWNSNAKQCFVAQTLLNAIFRSYLPDQLKGLPNLNYCIQSLIPYSNRHFSRLTRLLQDSMLVEYMAKCASLNPLQPNNNAKIESLDPIP